MFNKSGSHAILTAAFIVGGLFANTNLWASSAPAAKAKILSTMTYLDDLVKIISGSTFNSESLMGAGVDPHLYKASARDLSKIKNAQLVLALGLHLEGRMNEVLEQLKERGHPLIFVGESLPKSQLFPADPHVWFDPSLWVIASETVLASLIKLSPEDASKFSKNQKSWAKRVSKAHAELKKLVAEIPKNRRVLITSHDAFRYWGRAFDVEVKAIQGISTDSEASLKHIQELSEQIKSNHIPAIFIESSVSPASIERLKSIANVKIGGELFSDSLGGPLSDGPTYLEALKHNTMLFLRSFK